MNIRKYPHVVIIGAGFAGLETARGLANAPVRITLIDKHNHHLFQPLLYQVAIAGLLPSQIAQPVRTIFRRQKNLAFQMGEVTEINLGEKFVRLNGSVIAYDYLVIAAGARTNFFGFEALEKHGLQLKDLETAVKTRNHLLSMFEQASHEGDPEKRKTMLTFVIVGGGPTGVETAGALAELITHVMRKDYPRLNLKEARVILLEAGANLIGAYPDELRRATLRLLQKKKVDVRLNSKMKDFNGQRILLEDGSIIETQTLIWTAGAKAAELIDSLPVEKAGMGRVRVTPTMQLPLFPDAFVIGDAAFLVNGNGQPLPMLSTVAIQQGQVTAKNIRRMIAGKEPFPFHYKDPGLLATIGRNAAVARIFGISFSGFIAWVIWVFLHIYRIIGFRNRLIVMFNWAWDYFFYDNQVRLITKE
ncbi:MAG: FAD-dependent oxidoreductase [Chloroflexi bacterium]|nr:FAD-dependent oxidoreductase [Chloroflexota bacterium]MDL1940881.1 NAD(P)/FAD-dependent oxidoreductase [Chloroflexi bacterium CFX2]